MKKFIFLIQFLVFFYINAQLDHIYDPDDWIENGKIYVTKHSPSQGYRVLWMNTYSQELYPCQDNYPFPGDWSEEDRWMERYDWMGKSYPTDQWITVSVADRVPENAKSIYLTGILIMTTGNTWETPYMTIKFRRKGCLLEPKHSHMASIASTPGSARSTMSVWVPLNENKEFEFMWTRSTGGQWPTNTAYGISLYLNAFGS